MGEWKLDVDGVTKDFDTDYGFKVKSFPGTGHSPVVNRSTDYALQDGALFTGQKMGVRVFTLIGAFYGSATLAAFHDQRQALIKALSSRTVKINQKPATIKITYTGGTVDKEIDCIYEGGLELAQFVPFIENDVPVRFTAFDPQWNTTSDTVVALDAEDTLGTVRIWERVDDIWSNVGTGLNLGVRALIVDLATLDMYAGGSFTTAGGASASKIAKWDGSAWSALGSGLDNTCYAIAITPASGVYAGGQFTNAGGGGANYIALWNGSAWSALGSGLDNWVYDIAYNEVTTDLYVCGQFTNAGGGSANRVAKWDGAAWSALGTGLNGVCNAVALDSAGNLYVGGSFTTAGGGSANRIAKWDGATWTALGTGLSATCETISVDSDDNVYAGGGFTTAGGVSAEKIAKWDGSVWVALGSGLDNTVYDIHIEDDEIYVSGAFLSSDPQELGNVAKWDGSSWVDIGIDLAGTSYAVTKISETVYASTNSGNAPIVDGYTTISYTGTEVSYPVFDVTRTGGTLVNLLFLRNSKTGAIINFDYSLVDGEKLTIDFRPGQRSVTSSVYGSKWDAILDNSDTANFFLQPGNGSGTTDNTIILSVYDTGSPTITANLTYRTAYRSLD